MYDEGMGIAQDVQLAYMWYSLAAEQGNETARKNPQ